MAAAQSYDAVQLMLRVMFQTRGNTSGDVLKAALESLERPYAGVVTTHDKPFSATDHDAFTRNMVWLGVWRKGEIQFQYPRRRQARLGDQAQTTNPSAALGAAAVSAGWRAGARAARHRRL